MSRWQPNARGRLEQATLELFAERGYEQTTVAEIAGRAGLTERTFFRHFTDKREALFSGQGALEELLVNAVAAAPQAATPIDAVAAALAAAGAQFAQRREDLQLRQAIIATYPELAGMSGCSTPVAGDPIAVVPVVAALFASLIHPPLWRKFHAGAVGPYAVTPEAWDKILAAAE